MAKSQTASEIVARAQAKNADAGGGRLTINLLPAEMAIWQTLLDRQPPGRGRIKAALMDALTARLDAGEADIPAILRQIANQLEAKK